MKAIVMFAVIVGILVFTNCAEKPMMRPEDGNSQEDPMALSDAYYLTDKELKFYKNAAEGGDKEAAQKVYLYYAVYKQDASEKTERWRRMYDPRP